MLLRVLKKIPVLFSVLGIPDDEIHKEADSYTSTGPQLNILTSCPKNVPKYPPDQYNSQISDPLVPIVHFLNSKANRIGNQNPAPSLFVLDRRGATNHTQLLLL
jgi:hypothetical protein